MGKKVLIVDDHQETRVMTKLVLEKANFEVITAANGRDGFRKAQTSHPDMVLLDIMMPILEGYTLNQHLKMNPDTAHIPVIITSARGDAANPQRLLLKLDDIFNAKSSEEAFTTV